LEKEQIETVLAAEILVTIAHQLLKLSIETVVNRHLSTVKLSMSGS
jgi:hypothetical protein